MSDRSKAKKKTGRRPYPVDRKRVRIGVRIKPQTNDFLLAMKERLADGEKSVGRAIDYCVDLIRESGIDPFSES